MRAPQALTLAAALLATLPAATAWGAAAAAVADPGDNAQAASNAMEGVDIVPVSSNIAMVMVDGENIAVQYGPDGVLVVDSGAPGDGAAVLAAIRHISSQPIRFIVNSSASPDRVGNNAALAKAGHGFVTDESGFSAGRFVGNATAPIIARLNVLTAMSRPTGNAYPSDAMPTLTYSEGQENFSLNGDSIEVVPAAAAHSDGDSMVVFRRSDVIVAGDLLDMRHFPQIDVARGGSIDGEIAALNHLVDIVVPALPLYWHGGGTTVIPGRGRLAQALEIVQYRDMVTIVRDRVAALIEQHRTLAQVQAADPTAGYDSRYGAKSGPWSTDRFVAAIYQSLTASPARRRGR